MSSHGQVGWYLTDHLGSTRLLVTNSGAVLDKINYDAFGNITSQSSVGNEPLFLYTGQQWDSATGLLYGRARYYDPVTGRWISQDFMGFASGDSNFYRYVGNRPTGANDPSGLLECDDRENAPGNRRLVNVGPTLERHVNEIISEERNRLRQRLRGQRDETTRYAEATAAVRRVFNRLGANVPGTGVDAGFPVGSVSQVSAIEKWLKDNLSSATNQINQLTFLQSRYRFNRVGQGTLTRSPWWLATPNSAILNHAIAPTIRIDPEGREGRFGTLLGTDKWGHFFQQGFWLFELNQNNVLQDDASRVAFSRFLEGNHDPANRPVGERARFARIASGLGVSEGIHGDKASGVISQADINANLAGFQFYFDLFSDFYNQRNSFVFRVRNYSIRRLNEVNVENVFTRGVSADDSDRPGPARPRIR